MTGKPAYEVLARKYRPQQFSDVVGQEHVTKTLSNAIQSNRIAHAYLLVGPRGIGKTSIARIFSKALNCRTGPAAEPCGQCDSCMEIAAGRSLDVLEIDGASNNGVEQVRELRDHVQYVPARGPYKVYIIDEVHMLSMAAFNALLKTLEEPPQHVKFVFATTEPQKVPATIASRCQRFDLRRISPGDIAGHLRKIARLEQITVDDEALFAIARGAEGGMRDAESAFDQLISFCGRTIVEADVLSVFGLVSRQTLEALALATLRGEITGILSGLAELDQIGKDLPRVVLDLLEHFRNVLVVQQGATAAAGLDLPDRQVEALKVHAAEVDSSQLLRIIELLIETEGRLRLTVSRRTLLEVSLLRCARAATTVSIEGVLRQLAALKRNLGVPDSDPGTPPAPRPDRTTYAPPADRPPARTLEAPTAAGAKPLNLPAGGKNPPAEDPSPSVAEADPFTAAWADVLAEVSRVAPRMASMLRGARIRRAGDGTVQIEVDPERVPRPGALEDPKNQRALLQAVQRKLGAQVSVQTTLATPAAGAAPEATVKPGETAASAMDSNAMQWLEKFNGSVQ
jgi:DNA polymerase-3 subunit gamma/tau